MDRLANRHLITSNLSDLIKLGTRNGYSTDEYQHDDY